MLLTVAFLRSLCRNRSSSLLLRDLNIIIGSFVDLFELPLLLLHSPERNRLRSVSDRITVSVFKRERRGRNELQIFAP